MKETFKKDMQADFDVFDPISGAFSFGDQLSSKPLSSEASQPKRYCMQCGTETSTLMTGGLCGSCYFAVEASKGEVGARGTNEAFRPSSEVPGRAAFFDAVERSKQGERRSSEASQPKRYCMQCGTETSTLMTGGLCGSCYFAVEASKGETVDQAIVDLLRDLHAAHPQLRGLDALSLERVLAKGPSVDHLKGQLLEEIIESRLVPWLSSREGSFALGMTVPAGKKLEFIPGRLIRDVEGRQITDGMLVFREGEDLVVAAVFEAKAGKHAARELSLKRASLSGLTDAECTELRANAKDVWREQRAEARAAGKTFNKTLEEVEKEYAMSELGGQVRRDVERLAEGTAGPSRIRVGTQEFTVRMSPTRTKFFGVLPSDVRAATIEAQLKEIGFSYEILGVDIRASALKDIASSLQPLAEALAKAAP